MGVDINACMKDMCNGCAGGYVGCLSAHECEYM